MTARTRARRAFGAFLLVAVVFAGGGIVGARWIESPQEAAAERKPPAPSLLTASVEYRVLSDTLVTRGQVAVGRKIAVPLMASGDAKPIVTGVHARAGKTVKPGQAVIEVSGRPVLLLEGRIPAYRDLRPGATGEDVRQLQTALIDLGYSVGSDTTGRLGPGTQHAIRSLYEAAGYDAPTTGNEADVESARSGVTQAERSYEEARVALHRATAAPREAGAATERRQAISDAERALTYAAEDLGTARRLLSEALAASGPMLPLSEIVFIPAFPATVASVDVQVGSPADGTGLSLDMGRPRITTTVDPERRTLLRDGMRVKVLMPGSQREIDATITSIGPETQQECGGITHTVVITPARQLPRSAVGADVRVTVTTASTGHRVLVVPLSAVTSAADGTTNVSVLRPSGGERRVQVRAGVSASGYVEIRPRDPGALAAGERVVVGR